jgi:serine/threonine protein kinase
MSGFSQNPTLSQSENCDPATASLGSDLRLVLTSAQCAVIEQSLVAIPQSQQLDRICQIVESRLREYPQARRDFVIEDFALRFPAFGVGIRARFAAGKDSANLSIDSTAVDSAPAVRLRPTLAADSTIGGYQLVELLGQGGFGEVWKAWDSQLDRYVAIKFLRRDRRWAEHADDVFQREAKQLAKLNHPHILPVLQFGIEGELRYLVFPLIDGQSLAKRLEGQQTFASEAAAKLVEQVAEAVHHAHRRGIFHRDIKPANILLDAEGKPYLADFGLAIDETSQLDESPGVSGTWAYMSPEQVLGRSHVVEARSDIYSLGVVLYRMLTGRTPFRGRNLEEWREQIVERPPAPLRTLNPAVPERLDEICLKCLAKSVEARYRTAEDLARDLRNAFAIRRPVVNYVLAAAAIIVSTAWLTALWMTRGTLHSPAAGTQLPSSRDETAMRLGIQAPTGHVVVPQAAIWPVQDQTSHWEVAANGEALSLTCESIGLVEIGDVPAEEWRVSVHARQLPWSAGAGLFWGFRRSTENANQLQYHCLRIDAIAERFEVQHQFVIVDRIEGKILGAEVLASASIARNTARNADATKDCLVSLRFLEGRIADIHVRGERLPPPNASRHPEATMQRGKYGVLSIGSSTTYSELTINGQPMLFATGTKRE